MIYIISIGYRSYAFANSRGLQTVMDALSRARELKHHYFQGCEKENPERLELEDGDVEITMHVVRGVSFVSGKSKRTVIEPEVLPREPRFPPAPRKRPAALALKGNPARAETMTWMCMDCGHKWSDLTECAAVCRGGCPACGSKRILDCNIAGAPARLEMAQTVTRRMIGEGQ